MQSNDSKATEAITKLRIQVALKEITKTQIAKKLGLNRQTVARYLKTEEIPLDVFVAIADAIGEDPAKLLEG